MKIVQFGLRYSPNTGDGVIAECIAHGLRGLRPDADVTMIDMSGRDDFGAVTVRNRDMALRILQALPLVLRQALVRWRLGRLLDRAVPVWAGQLDGADMALIGGGQIFSDADLNFCLKIARVSELLEARQIPVAIHAVGVSQNWTRAGKALFETIWKTDLRRVGPRDQGSLRAWIAQMGSRLPAPVLTRDPGLLASECYGPAPQRNGRIGLCVTDPAILAYHADGRVAGSRAGAAFYAELAEALCGAGHQVTLFCNGAVEDRRALEEMVTTPRIAALTASGAVLAAPTPATPTELAAIIAPLRAVVAHRLHACIVAWSYRLPVVGLGWDRKVENFFASVNGTDFFAGSAGASPDEVAGMVEAALTKGIDPALHAKVLEETRAGIAAALEACGC